MIAEWDTLSDNITLDDNTERRVRKFKESLNEISAGQKFVEELNALASREGSSITALNSIIDSIADEYEYDYGIAAPSFVGDSICYPILAKNSAIFPTRVLEDITEPLIRGEQERNSWTVPGKRIFVMQRKDFEEKDKIFIEEEYSVSSRYSFLVESIFSRDGLGSSVKAEFKALELLETRVSEKQYRSYVLSNAFIEKSKRSKVYYIFRKGLPIIAMRAKRILACLCFHSYGYYQGTHTGVMCPTDDVIAALLFMRADEHKFWAKSNQWPPGDSRSGL